MIQCQRCLPQPLPPPFSRPARFAIARSLLPVGTSHRWAGRLGSRSYKLSASAPCHADPFRQHWAAAGRLAGSQCDRPTWSPPLKASSSLSCSRASCAGSQRLHGPSTAMHPDCSNSMTRGVQSQQAPPSEANAKQKTADVPLIARYSDVRSMRTVPPRRRSSPYAAGVVPRAPTDGAPKADCKNLATDTANARGYSVFISTTACFRMIV